MYLKGGVDWDGIGVLSLEGRGGGDDGWSEDRSRFSYHRSDSIPLLICCFTHHSFVQHEMAKRERREQKGKQRNNKMKKEWYASLRVMRV